MQTNKLLMFTHNLLFVFAQEHICEFVEYSGGSVLKVQC